MKRTMNHSAPFGLAIGATFGKSPFKHLTLRGSKTEGFRSLQRVEGFEYELFMSG